MGGLFASIKHGHEKAIAHQKGERTGIRIFTPEEVNVEHVQKNTGLHQQQLTARFGISIGNLRRWERGDRRPHGPAPGT